MLFNENVTLRYYLFSISNLFAAFGGGLILGKGTSIIDSPYLHGGSILAFFIGTILGLAFLQFIPKKSSNLIAKFFSINCGVTSLILYFLYQNTSYNTKITGAAGFIFFLLLSIRFGFWFYSRVMRASIAAGHQQSIAWVEFGYYIGMVLGLIIWKLFNINLELGTALLIDAAFQLIAGGLDLKNFTLDKNSLEASKQEARPKFDKKAGSNHSTWLWSLTSAVVFLTIGVQVVIFNTAHYVTEVFGSYLLATFYLGVALAAFVCNKYNIHIAWENKNQIAAIIVNHSKKTYRISFMLMMLMFIRRQLS